jgi:hypothetical protein
MSPALHPLTQLYSPSTNQLVGPMVEARTTESAAEMGTIQDDHPIVLNKTADLKPDNIFAAVLP